MTRHWRIADADETLAAELAQNLQIPVAIGRLLVARGISSAEVAEKFFRKSMNDLVHPLELPGMKKAAERLAQAVSNKEKILIHGDFDADGITSTALLTSFFKDLGSDVIAFVPNRLFEGHGISKRAIEIAKEQCVRIVITCDCGTSSVEEIKTLGTLGIETIVTDHHAIPETLPKGAILVNPKLREMEGGHEDLSGVGVAFMLCAALRSELRDQSFFAGRVEPNLKTYLDVVALGTLADMASLRGQNRILVAHGLKQIARSTRVGLIAMRQEAGLANAASIRSDDVGFRLAPKINAAARLGHSEEALELLLTTDPIKAELLAKKLEDWNLERKSLQEKMTRLALGQAQRQVQLGKKSIVVSHEEFHSGVVGLVAQKLSSQFSRPVFAFAIEGEVAKGSARSRSGANVVAAMEVCSNLLLGFGGHEEAGGCTLLTKDLSDFSNRFEEAISKQNVAAVHEVLIDAMLNLRHLNEGILNAIEGLAPFGIGNPEPAFVTKARLIGPPREVGKGHLKILLSDEKGGGRFGAIGFGLWNSANIQSSREIEVVYTPEFNDFQGRRAIQLRLSDLRSV